MLEETKHHFFTKGKFINLTLILFFLLAAPPAFAEYYLVYPGSMATVTCATCQIATKRPIYKKNSYYISKISKYPKARVNVYHSKKTNTCSHSYYSSYTYQSDGFNTFARETYRHGKDENRDLTTGDDDPYVRPDMNIN